MNHKPKLELTWIGKDQQPKLEPRILIEDPEKSYGDKNTENMLIYGDNLLALKALEQDFAGQIKCVAIDPPYNTGNAFEFYDDGLEHSIWLSLIKQRLEILKKLLREDGSIWISIDDYEMAYLKVLCDEIFGRTNFISTIIWQQRTTRENRKVFSNNHEYILVYSKNYTSFKETRNDLELNEEIRERYKNPDNDPRGQWQSVSLNAQGGHGTPSQFYTLIAPNGKKHELPRGRCWLYTKERLQEEIEKNNIWFGLNGNGVPRIKKFLSEAKSGLTPETLWLADQVGTNDKAKKNLIKMFNEQEVFETPKPEELLHQIIHIASNVGDYVLDSFLGSGTSASVAHKMNRKWIGIELGEHCHTHCIPRLQKVCEGTDQGGISEAVEWKGGGGFKYYYLAPSLLKQDKYNNWVINPEYNGNMLASAMAKHEGFRYQPDEQIYWKQGQSTEKDFIYTTTQFITVETLDRIHEEMQNGESILICCKSFSKACDDRYSNITIKKIPKMLLGRCEFGKEDYSLNIINMPVDPNEPDFIPKGFNDKKDKIKKKKENDSPTLFSK